MQIGLAADATLAAKAKAGTVIDGSREAKASPAAAAVMAEAARS